METSFDFQRGGSPSPNRALSPIFGFERQSRDLLYLSFHNPSIANDLSSTRQFGTDALGLAQRPSPPRETAAWRQGLQAAQLTQLEVKCSVLEVY